MSEWPKAIDGCAICAKGRGESAYGARGLCYPCYFRERYLGNHIKFEKVPNHSRDNPARYIATLVGCTEAAAAFNVEKEVFRKWAEGEPPKRVASRLRRYLAGMLRVEKDPDRMPLPLRHHEPRSAWKMDEPPVVKIGTSD